MSKNSGSTRASADFPRETAANSGGVEAVLAESRELWGKGQGLKGCGLSVKAGSSSTEGFDQQHSNIFPQLGQLQYTPNRCSCHVGPTCLAVGLCIASRYVQSFTSALREERPGHAMPQHRPLPIVYLSYVLCISRAAAERYCRGLNPQSHIPI